jgi:hypothetical protein
VCRAEAAERWITAPDPATQAVLVRPPGQAQDRRLLE